MSRRKKHNQRKANRKKLKEKKALPEAEAETIALPFIKREEGERNLPPTILIVCEGETEASYFHALKDILGSKLKMGLEILPEKMKQSNFSALSTLLDVAIKKMQQQEYHEVWLLTDNDEDAAYKLDNASIQRIALVNDNWANSLRQNQYVNLNVRSEETEKTRIRYFLNQSKYDSFLKDLLPDSSPDDRLEIIARTRKNNSFEQFENDRLAFYQKNKQKQASSKIKKQLAQIKIAFSAISFEHWLLLHYEYSQSAFYNSREYLLYFDEKNYLSYIDAKGPQYFKKGFFLYEKKDLLQNFFASAESSAIPNAIRLENDYVRPLINSGLKYYEINPSSDVFQLLSHFIQTRFLNLDEIIALRSNTPQKKLLLEELSCSLTPGCLEVKFRPQRPILKRQIKDAISFKKYPAQPHTAPNMIFNPDKTNYHKNDLICIEIDISAFLSSLLHFFYFDLTKLFAADEGKLCFPFRP